MFINESEISKEMGLNGGESEVLPVGKVEQELNETKSLASPEVKEETTLEPMVSSCFCFHPCKWLCFLL